MKNMIALSITQIKNFMNQLLTTSCFDSFLLAEAAITTYNTFLIDGHQNRDFYSAEEWADPELHPYPLSAWGQMRGLCFDLIKGKRTPVSFKIVLHLMPEPAECLLRKGTSAVSPELVDSFVLTIRYDNRQEHNSLVLTTGVSFRNFVPDKTPEQLWDKTLKNFLVNKQIVFEEQ